MSQLSSAPFGSHANVAHNVLFTEQSTFAQGSISRPEMLTGLQLHFAPFPGSASATPLHTVCVLMSQLVQVPASAVPSLSLSTHTILTVNCLVVKRQVALLSAEHVPVTAFPQGSVFEA